jgi:hypothetical protein
MGSLLSSPKIELAEEIQTLQHLEAKLGQFKQKLKEEGHDK